MLEIRSDTFVASYKHRPVARIKEDRSCERRNGGANEKEQQKPQKKKERERGGKGGGGGSGFAFLAPYKAARRTGDFDSSSDETSKEVFRGGFSHASEIIRDNCQFFWSLRDSFPLSLYFDRRNKSATEGKQKLLFKAQKKKTKKNKRYASFLSGYVKLVPQF